MGKTNKQLQAENDELKEKLAEKPDVVETTNATILAENDELKAKIANLALQKGLIDIPVSADIEATTYIYKAVYPRKLKIMKAIIHNISDGQGGYTREKVRDSLYVKFEGSQHGAFFTLNKRIAEQKGITVSEFKHHLERSSQFGVDVELLISSKDDEEIQRFISKLKPKLKSANIVSGVSGA